MVKTFDLVTVLTLLLIVVCALPTVAQADEHELESDHEVTHESHPNMLAFFVGVSAEGRRENGLALGVEYERRLNESFGVGVLAEHTFGDLDIWVYAVPFAYHTGRWKFYIAPGIEDGDHGNESLVRLGGEYGYEVGAWEISPQFDVDFIDGDQVLVLGVTFGKGF
jgi:hypothetical protein